MIQCKKCGTRVGSEREKAESLAFMAAAGIAGLLYVLFRERLGYWCLAGLLPVWLLLMAAFCEIPRRIFTLYYRFRECPECGGKVWEDRH